MGMATLSVKRYRDRFFWRKFLRQFSKNDVKKAFWRKIVVWLKNIGVKNFGGKNVPKVFTQGTLVYFEDIFKSKLKLQNLKIKVLNNKN